MTTRKPTPGHTLRGHSSDHHSSDHSQRDHSPTGHNAMATLVGTARVVTKWAAAGGLIAAASFAAGWIERGHDDGR